MVYQSNIGDVPTNRSVTPEGCLSFAEQSLYVAEYAEEEFNALFESIGLEELFIFENTGSTILYEGAKFDSFKQKVIKLFQKIFAAIKGAYEKILDFFEQKRRESVRQLVNIDSSYLKLIKDDQEFGTTHEFKISEMDNIFESGAKIMLTDTQDEFDAIVKNPTDDMKSRAADCRDNLLDKLVPTVSGCKGYNTIGEVRKPLAKKLTGEEVKVTKKWLSENLGKLTEVVKKGTSKRDIQASYKKEKSTFDDLIRKLKKSKDENIVKVANEEIAVLKATVTALHSCMNIKIDVCKRRYSEYKVILTKLSKLKKESESVNASYSYSSQQDLVESAFNW